MNILSPPENRHNKKWEKRTVPKYNTVDMVRIVAQTGDGAPYIAVIKF